MHNLLSTRISIRTMAMIAIVVLLVIQIPSLFAQGLNDLNDVVAPELLDLVAPQAFAFSTVGASTQSAIPSFSSVDATTDLPAPIYASGQFNSVVTVNNGNVVIDAMANGNTQALFAELQALGLQNGNYFGNIVSGSFPISSILQLGTVANLEYMSASVATTNAGSVLSEAVPAMRVDDAMDLFGVDGTGLTIGILSDSFDCGQPTVPNGGSYAADIASGDLPDDVVVLEDYFEEGCIDEGRAMAQLVHDVAPGAKILFHTAFGGQAVFAQGIIDLADAGADVIVDDVSYFAEPYYQDGIIAQAVDEVYARGIPYFSSAGNSADQAYEAPFLDSGFRFTDATTGFTYLLHDYDSGPLINFTDDMSITAGSSVVILQWDDPFASLGLGSPGTDSDLGLLLFSPDLSIYYGCFCNNALNIDPVAGFSVGGPFEFTTLVGLREGTNPDVLFKRYYSSSALIVENTTNSSTTYGHSNAVGAVAVGAAFFGTTPEFGVNPPLLNSFSSYGTTPIFFDIAGNRLATPEVRPRPQITAVDGTNTTFFFGDTARDADTLPNFFGTSASAPHAAAVAALMLEANPALTPDEVLQNMQLSAIDIVGTNDVGGPVANQNIALPVGFDEASGAGLIQADAAITFSISSTELVCNGLAATIYVENGVIVGGPLDGQLYQGVLRGTDGNDVIVGTNVNDSIRSGNQNDTVCGFAGDDSIYGGEGDDNLFGDVGDDLINGGGGRDLINGDDGMDRLLGTSGEDTINGGNDADTINGGGSQDIINGDDGADNIHGSMGDDTINGGEGDDVMRGGTGQDRMYGEAGNDQMFGQIGDDEMRGGDGEDELRGGNNNDSLYGEADNDVLFGNDGDDRLFGGSGEDLCNGGANNDTGLNCEMSVSIP